MILDTNNNMIGRAPHVRDVGPHAHDALLVGLDGARARYFECSVCGARWSDAYGGPAMAARRDWLMGGEWSTTEPVLVMPSSPQEVVAAMAEQRLAEIVTSAAHRAALPQAPTLADPLHPDAPKPEEVAAKNAEDTREAGIEAAALRTGVDPAIVAEIPKTDAPAPDLEGANPAPRVKRPYVRRQTAEPSEP